VIGHFVSDQAVAGEAGIRPYVFVEQVDETLERVAAYGGEVVIEPYPEGDLWVAVYRDPAGNVVGLWQTGVATTVISHAIAANTLSRSSTHSRSKERWTLGGRRRQRLESRLPAGFQGPAERGLASPWTFGGRRDPESSPYRQTKGAEQQELREAL
jgi:hypothetical protein